MELRWGTGIKAHGEKTNREELLAYGIMREWAVTSQDVSG